MNGTPSLTRATGCEALTRRQRFCAMSSSLNAISSALVREPAPLVTRCRRRTVANVDSIAFVVRRCCQCSAGKSKKVSRQSSSLTSDSAAFGYLAPYSSLKRSISASASSRHEAYMISCSARFARA